MHQRWEWYFHTSEEAWGKIRELKNQNALWRHEGDTSKWQRLSIGAEVKEDQTSDSEEFDCWHVVNAVKSFDWIQ